MGIIQRQTLKSSAYSYIGVIFGFITAGWLMPTYLTTSEIGVLRQIQYYALFISSILAFGVPQSLVRMFPHFKNSSNKNHGFTTLVSGLTLFSILIFALLFKEYGALFLKADIVKSDLFESHYHFILPFTIALMLFTLFDSYATSNQESTIGVFLKDFALRIFLLILLLVYIFTDFLNYPNLVQYTAYVQFVPFILLLFFLNSKKLLAFSSKISFPSRKIRNEFFSVSGFNWINGLSAVAVVTIDSIMLSKLTDSSTVGIYTTVTFYAGLMLIPNKSLGKIASSVISNHFKNNQLDPIKSIYKKSAFMPYVLGLFLFGNLILFIPFIFQILLQNKFNTGIYVLVFLALSNLFKMSTGVKFSIIFNSKYYRWSTLMFIGFVGLIVGTNLIFIPKYGIVGAAIASLIATTSFHVAGLLFVKYKFGYWPFDKRFIKLSLVFTLIAGAIFLLPDAGFPIWASVVKSTLFSMIYLIYIYFSKTTPEINDQINDFLGKK